MSIPTQLRGVIWSMSRILNADVRSPTQKLEGDWGLLGYDVMRPGLQGEKNWHPL